MVEVGQKYRVLPAFVGNNDTGPRERKQVGTVVEVHPRKGGGWARLGFGEDGGEPFEGFRLDVLTEDKLVTGKKGKRK